MNGLSGPAHHDDEALEMDFEGILTSVFGTLDVSESPALVESKSDSEHPEPGPVSPQSIEETEKKDKKERPYFKSVYIPLPKERFKFMSHAEISIVIRHSLQSLQTKNPMDDDFYYQVYTARQGGPWKGVGLPGIEISGPMVVNRFRNADGTPILPEGTLGRVAMGTFRKPRTLLQLSGSAKASEDQKSPIMKSPSESSAIGGPRRFMFARFSLHYLIEEGIRCIMDVEDVDNLLLSFPSTSAQEAANQQMLNLQRVKLGKRLLEHLGINEIVDANGVPIPQQFPIPPPDQNHIIFKYGNLAKGRNLILRSLMCLQPEQVYLIVHVMVARLGLFAFPAEFSAIDGQFGPVLEKHLEHWSPTQINSLMSLFLSSPYNTEHIFEIARSTSGSALILFFCKIGHILRSHPMPAAVQSDLAIWLDSYRRLYAIMAPNFDLVFPEEPHPSCADVHTQWRILADLSSHAGPNELALIPRSGRLWELIEKHVEQHPPAVYFANLVLSIYRDQGSVPSQYNR